MIDEAVKLVQDKAGNTPRQYKYYRELLDKEKPEISIMATPDHWHPLKKNEPEIHEDPQLHQPGGQNVSELWADFIDAIQKKRRPICDIEIGHHSTTLALLGMLSWKLGRSIEWDGEKEQCTGDAEANALLRREYRDPWKYPPA